MASPISVAGRIPFSELAVFLENVQKKHGTDNKRKLFKDFLDKWRVFHAHLHKDDSDNTDTFYPVMRLLLPQLERERLAYGIKEHTLAKLYIEILGLSKESQDAKKLINYRAPTAKQEAGDFASVAFFVLRNRCPEKGSLTIKEVNDSLDGIASNNAANKKDVVKKNLMHLLRNTSATEQKWLIRMIMKEMKVGLSQSSIFSVFHQDAEEYFNVTNSLAKVCKDLMNPESRMNEIAIEVFSPFSPMLGMRATLSQVEKLMDHKPFFIETKVDGERMQLHKDGDKYKYFSRRSHEYSNVFGENSFSGTFTQYAAKYFKSDVKSCILDGEVIAYNPETKAFMSKGENFDVKSMRDTDLQVCFIVFDILLLNGQKLANKPFRERFNFIPKVFTPKEGRLEIVQRQAASTKKDVVDALNKAIDDREEGIVVKNPDSTYRPDKRKGSGWLKIKPEYMDNMMDELDLLIIGGYFGKGKRSRVISHFLLGVAVPPSKQGDEPKLFKSFCKVGSGYTYKELYDLNVKLMPHWKPLEKDKYPEHLLLSNEKPEIWIEPSKSVIVQVKATEITYAKDYKTGCTLRFPRVEKLRDDKAWNQCMTADELDNLKKLADGKLASRHAVHDDDNQDIQPQVKKRKVTSRVEQKASVAERFRGADTSSLKQISKLFEDMEFCIFNGPSDYPKVELEKKVVEHGGKITQNPSVDTYCVIAEKINVKVQNVISSGEQDVVQASWLIDCLKTKRRLPWLPHHMIHKSHETAAYFEVHYDSHGDSYTEDVTVDKLQEIFENIGKQGGNCRLSTLEIAQIEHEYFPDESPLGLFRLCRVYMDKNLIIDDPTTEIKDSTLEMVALEMRFHGATLVDVLDDQVSHIVFDKSDLTRLKEFRNLNHDLQKKRHLVSTAWVKSCVEDKRLKRERDYEPDAPV
ncbi:DNA ligase 4-like isoform X2 [Anneissia japonica]|uniref:DNA ligase 4-like isoform X2 n=1 Tax=Anneissia japonica TaxID=1529436 RepID=UPI0014255596|nr:DNA ligase 4-like isoform X2 [Anneissia japonica]